MTSTKDKICVHAWKGLYTTPLEAGMCCIQFPLLTRITPQTDIKNIRKQKIWNDIRESMLKGQEHPSCSNCWRVEKENNISSYRQTINERYPEEYKLIKSKNVNTLIDDNLTYIDVRQTNVCNMKCLSCGPVYSSLWNAEERTSDALKYSNGDAYNNTINKNGVLSIQNNDFDDYILSNLKHIKEVYFAGGEPMVNPLHWTILEELDRLQRYDVKLYYNTNLLKLDYKGKHVFDYWDKFSSWFAGCSIDAIGARAEYVRTGTKWSTVDHHLKLMQEKYPLNFDIDTTVSALSIAGLKDLIQYCNQLQIQQHRWSNTVVRPEYLHINVLPREYRQHLFNDMKSLVDNFDHMKHPLTNPLVLRNFLNHLEVAMLESDATDVNRYKFKQFIERKDKTRNTDIFTSCPEFKDLWSDI